MRTFLLPPEADLTGTQGADRLVLRGQDHHYLTRVLRLQEGDSFPATDGSGSDYRCTILSVSRDSLELQVTRAQATDLARPAVKPAVKPAVQPVPQPELYLYQALLKGKKMDTVIRQATEAGVAGLIPVETEHTIPSYEQGREAKKHQRWQKIAAEAVQQCGRTTLPSICAPIPLDEVPAHWAGHGTALLFHQDPLENSALHRYLSAGPHAVALCLGPEGGFSPREVDNLTTDGFAPVCFNSPVLRAETATIFALGAVHTILTERASWNPTHR